eukprot:scaffold15108_cov180-Amphora_coffeaeformis.AAC.75
MAAIPQNQSTFFRSSAQLNCLLIAAYALLCLVGGILLVSWLPQSTEGLAALSSKAYSGSTAGGIVFLMVVFVSMICICVVDVLNIFCPGWAGESR